MEHLAYAAIIVFLVAVASWLWFREHVAREKVGLEKIAIEGEERRFFGFLHGLGEKLQDDDSPTNLHRYIVDGVADVIGADAGILYLHDAPSDQLVPVCQTTKLAPVIPVPAEIEQIEEASEAEHQYRSYIRLSPLENGETLLWEAFQGEGFLHLEDMGRHPCFAASRGLSHFHAGVSLVAAPLVYGKKKVGVLAMTRGGQSRFSENDQEVFSSVAEQSSFALGSAIIHSEAAEKRRFERELMQASEIQRILLPKDAPELSDYDLGAEYRAARIVSGDYYDYLKVDEDRYGIAIGDVCGKGIAASLIMAMCRSNLRSRAPENLSPASVLHAVNRSIFPDIKEDMFVSLLYLILERGSNEITLARAGHEPPVLFRKATGSIEIIEPPGMAAGIDKGPVFKRSVKDHRFRMESGDVLLLYTDGIIESESPEGDEYGMDRLKDAVERYSGYSSNDLVQAIIEEAVQFSAGGAQIDDITLIAIEKR